MNPYTFIIFGASGSGKGTQASLLIKYLEKNHNDKKTYYVETGQKFRDFITNDQSWTAQMSKELMEKGELLPEFLPVWMWTEFLVKNVSGNEHLILEGLSRREHEAPILDSAMKFYKREKPFVISIEVSKDWAKERLMARGRGDDNTDDIEKRLSWYEESVKPAIEYFKENDYYTFVSVNGEQTIEGVHNEIMEKIAIK